MKNSSSFGQQPVEWFNSGGANYNAGGYSYAPPPVQTQSYGYGFEDEPPLLEGALHKEPHCQGAGIFGAALIYAQQVAKGPSAAHTV
jgi:hypothetical protein